MATNANMLASRASLAQVTAQITASAQADSANKFALVAYCANVPENVRDHQPVTSPRVNN